MSFSSEIKQELNKNSNLSNKNIVKKELKGYLVSGNTNIINSKTIKFSTESDYNINRFSKLLSNLNINHKIDITGKTFYITLKKKDIEDIELEEIGTTEEEKRAFVRGIFMGAGSINNPENKYHLEVTITDKEKLNIVKNLLETVNINIKTLETENKYCFYLKEGEEISKFLAYIGAAKAVMKFEDIRIKKDMRGKVNRLVNCETANLNKTINASIEQIEAINKLKQNGKFNKLDKNLKEVADLRLKNPNISLLELGKLLKNPVGKSGVNYRLKKIIEISKE